MNIKKVKTTINIEKDLLEEVKNRSTKKCISTEEYIIEAIKLMVDKDQKGYEII